MPAANWQAAIRYAQLVTIAYTVKPGDPYDDAAKALIQQSGYTFVEAIYGSELATDFDPHLGEVVTYGYLATSATGELVAVIRGTEGIQEWLHDAAFLFVPNPIHPAGGFTEDGFSAIYRSLRVGADPNSAAAVDAIASMANAGGVSSITVTGHSLGAALATMLGLAVGMSAGCKSPTVYTYACPRVGDLIFGHTYDSLVQDTLRIHHRSDLVPKLPTFPYEHVGNDIELIAPLNAVNGTLACWHSLDTYLWLMDQQLNEVNHLKVDQQCQGPKYPGPV
ncbi:MAG TPA: lipase family protein [Acidobacteriaceae bacterium]|jgi:hypothetical protein|nr:lipase family protein [Acidobacteriaceae bacterium]